MTHQRTFKRVTRNEIVDLADDIRDRFPDLTNQAFLDLLEDCLGYTVYQNTVAAKLALTTYDGGALVGKTCIYYSWYGGK